MTAIRSYLIDTKGPAGSRRYRVTDTGLGPDRAVVLARFRYCIDTVGLDRLDEVSGVADAGSAVDWHTPRPVMLT